MGIRARVRVTSRLPQWIDKTIAAADAAALEMATDIHRQSTILAPRDSGDLVSTGRVEKVLGGYAVTYGGSYGVINVPYARIQELGGETGRNHATVIRGQHYLGRAGENVSKDKRKYFRNK